MPDEEIQKEKCLFVVIVKNKTIHSNDEWISELVN